MWNEHEAPDSIGGAVSQPRSAQKTIFIQSAAKRFDELPRSDQRSVLEQSIRDIAAGAPL
jgi:hypothetical protein